MADIAWGEPFPLGCAICKRDCGYIVEQQPDPEDRAWIMFCTGCAPDSDDADYQQKLNKIWKEP